MTRRTKAERRLDYLDIGAQLVAEGGPSSAPDPGLALAHVRIADVAERAHVTKGALYHLWDSQEAFWHDLLEYLLEHGLLLGSPDVADLTVAALQGEDPSLRGWANYMFDTFKEDPSFFTRIGIFAYLVGDGFREELDQEFRTSLERFKPTADGALTGMGRRMRPGMDTGDLLLALSTLMQGLCLEYRIDPGRTPDLEVAGERLTLFAVGAEGLVDAFTQLLDGAETGGGR